MGSPEERTPLGRMLRGWEPGGLEVAGRCDLESVV